MTEPYGEQSPAPTWRKAPVAWVARGDRIVLTPLGTRIEPARVLEGTAAAIWSAVEEDGASTVAVVARVSRSLQVDAGLIADDVAEFLHTLRDEKLITADGVASVDE